MFKKVAAVVAVLASLVLLNGCSSDADIASHNVSKAADVDGLPGP